MAQRRADGRERILEAATALFADKGFEGTSTSAVARRASVAQPLVYHHFSSKEGLWRACMDRLLAETALFATLNHALRPDQALLAALEQFLRYCARHPEVPRIMSREATAQSPRLQYLVESYLKEQYTSVVRGIRLAQEGGYVRADVRAELLLLFLLGAGTHFFDMAPLAQQTLGVDPYGEDGEAFIKGVVEIVGRGVLTGPVA